ncbi:MAG: tRNA 2-thiouridine(34) synthase MnmA [Candidatus Aureabacteria bacterium]|nr:tRNA 2-thiouridine(34) synthase MnmA [Candidatus Auribacterota bacterium]
MKIIVGMSGGVDSAVASLLLKEQGHEVMGTTLRMGLSSDDGIRSAREVAGQIGIGHHVMDVGEEFRRHVVSYFCDAYRRGTTPNPCVICNPMVKFKALLDCAGRMGAHNVATGHYARIHEGRLLRGADKNKDQAYFLSRLPRAMLGRVIFPLGELRKEEVKRIAADHGLKVHGRPESQEICFIPDNDYRSFLKAHCGSSIQGGDILDCNGNLLDRHAGIEFFTIGQRGGLGITSATRRYVVAIDPARRSITVGGIDDLMRREMRVREINWLAEPALPERFRALIKIRYNHPGAMGTVTPGPDGTAEVSFDLPQKAVTPGQAAVFYSGVLVMGVGWIE